MQTLTLLLLSLTFNVHANDVSQSIFDEINAHSTLKVEYIPEEIVNKVDQANRQDIGNDKLAKVLEENRQKIKELRASNPTSKNIQDSKNPQHTYKQWRNQVKTTYSQWQAAQKEFLKNLPRIKENLILAPDIKEAPKLDEKVLHKEVSQEIKSTYNFVPGNYLIPVQNQGFRPTCSAFAGVRAVELLLTKENTNNRPPKKLSEQYFYWASKASCRNQKCSQGGSWVREGFEFGAIPTWQDCPYSISPVSGNETQIPLPASCQNGAVKVTQYQNLGTLDEMIIALENGRSVIIGLKLTPNFYVNKGFVTYKDSLSGDKKLMDNHALGHTVLFTGVVKLPKDLVQQEGKVCFMATNSWGQGWGQGGYACLSEQWVKNYRFPNAAMTIQSVKILKD